MTSFYDSHIRIFQSGRQDPVVKLKKQLAEKEKALAAEQEAHQAIQNKLKELRAELNIEKHANRQREETLNSRLSDMQTLNARLQVVSDEKQNLAKQLQQVRISWRLSVFKFHRCSQVLKYFGVLI